MIRIFHHFIPKVTSALLFTEILIFVVSLHFGAAIRFFNEDYLYLNNSEKFAFSVFVAALAIILSMSALGMYQLDFLGGIKKTFIYLLSSLLLGVCIITMIFYLFPQLYIGRGVLLLGIIISTILILALRACIYSFFKLPLLRSRIIFLGDGALAEQCHRHLALHHFLREKFDIVGFIPVASEECRVSSSVILPIGDSLVTTAKKFRAKEIIVSVQDRRSASFPISELLQCRLHGIKVTAASTFFERETRQIRVDSLQPSWLVFSDGFNQNLLRLFIKRVFDLLVSVIALIFFAPIMLITALYIYAEDRGPIFYRQERVGKDGKTFSVLKFRSMRLDAEGDGTPKWAAANDSRTTKVGRFIRKVRFDELPQFLNVLRGEMSFVGPRPERPHFVKLLGSQVPFYDMRHSIKPGITGFAQVRYQYGASIEDAIEKLQYDLYYVKNNSLFLDMLILIDTVQVILFSKGSR